MMRLRIVVVATPIMATAPAGAQDAAPAIADNSFLIEEKHDAPVLLDLSVEHAFRRTS
jgi:hypothetical protein